MSLNRREFVILTCAAAASGCGVLGGENEPIQLRPASVDAGPAADFAADGVYDQFARQGFFVVRRADQLVALSSLCTHRKCKLRAEPDHSFYCKCHGSRFDPAGHVAEGPATRDLPALPTTIDDRGHLIILALAGPGGTG